MDDAEDGAELGGGGALLGRLQGVEGGLQGGAETDAGLAPLCKCLALILGFGQCKIRTYEPSNWPANKVML